jgi:hypothetical protein
MSSKVKGCLAWEKAGRVKRRATKIRRRKRHLQRTGECSTGIAEVRDEIAEVNTLQELSS